MSKDRLDCIYNLGGDGILCSLVKFCTFPRCINFVNKGNNKSK